MVALGTNFEDVRLRQKKQLAGCNKSDQWQRGWRVLDREVFKGQDCLDASGKLEVVEVILRKITLMWGQKSKCFNRKSKVSSVTLVTK